MEHSRYFFSSRMETLPLSYNWFKYDILHVVSASCVVNWLQRLAANHRPRARLSLEVQMRRIEDKQNRRKGKNIRELIFVLLQNLPLQLGLGQRCQSEGIAIPYSSY